MAYETFSYAPSPATEVTHDVTGKVCLVTGANSGVGRVSALELARAGGHVFLACRRKEAAQEVIDAIKAETGNGNLEFLPLDLASLASVNACVDAFLERGLPLHVLMCNAGLAGVKGLTKDGFEMTIGVNHVGHFLMIQRLLETLKASAPARVVIVASRGHRKADGIAWDRVREPTKSLTGFNEYAQSKGMNILTARKLAQVLDGTGVTTYSLHPGQVKTSIWRVLPRPLRWFITRNMITNEEGARTQLWCATAPELASESGHYYDDQCQRAEPFAPFDGDSLTEELWSRSFEWAGLATPEAT